MSAPEDTRDVIAEVLEEFGISDPHLVIAIDDALWEYYKDYS